MACGDSRNTSGKVYQLGPLCYRSFMETEAIHPLFVCLYCLGLLAGWWFNGWAEKNHPVEIPEVEF
jgi:hypothetical protein